MRRTASEVIRTLENRVARLERESGLFDFFTGNISIQEVVSIIGDSHKQAKVSLKNGKIILSFTSGGMEYWFNGHFVRNKKKVTASALSNIMFFEKLKGSPSQGVDLRDPKLLVIEFEPDFRKMGLKETRVNTLNIHIDTYGKNLVGSGFKDRLKFEPVMNKLKRSAKP